MPSSPDKLTTEGFLAVLQGQREQRVAAGASSDADRKAFREAAAVLVYFDPATLQPTRRVKEPDAMRHLAGDIALYYGDPDFTRWTLIPEVRRETLKTIDRGRIQLALKANPDRPQEPVQVLMEGYLLGRAKPIDTLETGELAAALQITRWIGGVVEGVPTAKDVQTRLRRARLLDGFRRLVGEHFSGRQKELERLRDHVEVFPASTAKEALTRQLRRWSGTRPKDPLVIVGPGGIGKSTLVAKFALDHAQLDGELQIPFAYLDFDKPGLAAEEPSTLVLEAVRQLSAQYTSSEAASRTGEIEKLCFDQMALKPQAAQRVEMRSSTASSIAAQRTVHAEIRAGQTALVRGFAELVRDLPEMSQPSAELGLSSEPTSPAVRPFLVVLDTFEELQYRSQAVMQGLWSLLRELLEAYPKTRVVISGRAAPQPDPSIPRVDTMNLGDLDDDAAEQLLLSLGIHSSPARAVSNQVGGNPLTLKLAAEVLRHEEAGRRGITGLRTTSFLWFSRNERLVQGQLYARVLSHLHDEDVRKLAHPGLVTRRVTPDLIREVLAEPCGVDVPSRAAAEDLFERYGREVSLVEPAEDGSLRHRPDVRTRMLELLQQDKPAQVEAIHEAAVTYYGTKEGATARAEEIYHRLQLGQPPAEVDERWIAGAEQLLIGAVEEVPRAARAYLASKLGLSIDPALLTDDVDIRSWEDITAREAGDLLEDGQAEQTLDLIRKRDERSPGSPLFALEAEALNLVGLRDEARNIIERGIAEASRERQLGTLAELYPLAAEDAELRGDLDEALRHWKRAEEIVRHQGDPEGIQRILASRLRALRSMRPSDPGEVEAVEGELVDRFLASPESSHLADPLLVKRVVGLLGSEYEEVLKRSLSSVRIRPTDHSQYAELAAQLYQGLTTAQGLGETASSIILSYAQTLGIDVSEGLTSDVTFNILDSADASGRLEEFLTRFLETGEATSGVKGAIANLIDDRPVEA